MDRATVDQLLTTTRTVRKCLDLSRPVENHFCFSGCVWLQIDASSRLSTACRLAPGTKWP